jgi:hypothetical protein
LGAIGVGACGHARREAVNADVGSVPHSRVEPALLHQRTSCEGMGVVLASIWELPAAEVGRVVHPNLH